MTATLALLILMPLTKTAVSGLPLEPTEQNQGCYVNCGGVTACFVQGLNYRCDSGGRVIFDGDNKICDKYCECQCSGICKGCS